MRTVTLGSTGITVPKNAFGALPIQRVSEEDAVRILRRAYDGGMRFFDTARAYTDSEKKLGMAFSGMRDKIYISSKTMARTPDDFWKQLEESLEMLQTDYIDIYQFHMVPQCYRPGDGTGLYECMLEAKEKGMIRHIGVTAHLLHVAQEIAESGLYETLQFPLSYLSSTEDEALARRCAENNMGFIVMKALAGGLIRNADAAMAYLLPFENALPIWGIQKDEELEEWLAFMDHEPEMTDEIRAFIEQERKELSGSFCRGCGYCLSACPQDISINNCARMSLMLRRAPSAYWLSEPMQEKMKEIENCIECRACESKCPYHLPIPELLRENYDDYKKVLSGERTV